MMDASRLNRALLAVACLCTFALADAAVPEPRHQPIQTAQAGPSDVIIAIGFAVAGALLFIWLGRRGTRSYK